MTLSPHRNRHSCSHLGSECAGGRDSAVHLPVAVRMQTLRALPLRFRRRGGNHSAHVADRRLVLHLLRPVDPAGDHLAPHCATVVPVSIARVEHLLRAPLGDRVPGGPPECGRRLDLSLVRVRRQPGLQFLRRLVLRVVVGVEAESRHAQL